MIHMSANTDILARIASLEAALEGRVRDQDAPAYLTRTQAAAFCGIAPTTMDDYRRRGDLPCSRIGRKCIYRREDVVAWLARHTEVAK